MHRLIHPKWKLLFAHQCTKNIRLLIENSECFFKNSIKSPIPSSLFWFLLVFFFCCFHNASLMDLNSPLDKREQGSNHMYVNNNETASYPRSYAKLQVNSMSMQLVISFQRCLPNMEIIMCGNKLLIQNQAEQVIRSLIKSHRHM